MKEISLFKYQSWWSVRMWEVKDAKIESRKTRPEKVIGCESSWLVVSDQQFWLIEVRFWGFMHQKNTFCFVQTLFVFLLLFF